MEQEKKPQDIQTNEVKSATGKPERIRTPDFVSRYANAVVIVNTQFDLQFLFGQHTFEPNEKFVVNEHTLIAMSPAHAKSFFELFEQRLKDWEANFGKIELRKKVMPPKS